MRLASTLGCVLLGTVACTSFNTTDPVPTDAGMPADAYADAGGTSTLNAGLLARWRFDEGAGTTAGNDVATAPAGTITNAAWGEGKLGGALLFNGMSSQVQVTGSPTLDVTTAFTLAVWVNLTSAASDTGQRFVSRGPIDFKLNRSRPQIAISSGTYASSSFELPENQWHHLTAVYAANKAQIYVDGIVSTLVEDTFNGEPLAAQPGALWIGVREGDSGFFNGRIDDVRMWNRALSPSEVAAVFADR